MRLSSFDPRRLVQSGVQGVGGGLVPPLRPRGATSVDAYGHAMVRLPEIRIEWMGLWRQVPLRAAKAGVALGLTRSAARLHLLHSLPEVVAEVVP